MCVSRQDCGGLFDGSIEGPYNVEGALLCKDHARARMQKGAKQAGMSDAQKKISE